MRLLVDTHVIVRWLFDAQRLSSEQRRLLNLAVKRRDPVGICAITLLEIANLVSDGRLQIDTRLSELFDRLEGDPIFQLLPITCSRGKSGTGQNRESALFMVLSPKHT